jgi:hypothetical protein
MPSVPPIFLTDRHSILSFFSFPCTLCIHSHPPEQAKFPSIAGWPNCDGLLPSSGAAGSQQEASFTSDESAWEPHQLPVVVNLSSSKSLQHAAVLLWLLFVLVRCAKNIVFSISHSLFDFLIMSNPGVCSVVHVSPVLGSKSPAVAAAMQYRSWGFKGAGWI